MLNIIRKKPKMNVDALRERENKPAAAAAHPVVNNNQADPAGGTAVKASREGLEFAQR
jgi:hypothetical protein